MIGAHIVGCESLSNQYTANDNWHVIYTLITQYAHKSSNAHLYQIYSYLYLRKLKTIFLEHCPFLLLHLLIFLYCYLLIVSFEAGTHFIIPSCAFPCRIGRSEYVALLLIIIPPSYSILPCWSKSNWFQ